MNVPHRPMGDQVYLRTSEAERLRREPVGPDEYGRLGRQLCLSLAYRRVERDPLPVSGKVPDGWWAEGWEPCDG